MRVPSAKWRETEERTVWSAECAGCQLGPGLLWPTVSGTQCDTLSTDTCSVQAFKGKTKAMQTQRHDGSETTANPLPRETPPLTLTAHPIQQAN